LHKKFAAMRVKTAKIWPWLSTPHITWLEMMKSSNNSCKNFPFIDIQHHIAFVSLFSFANQWKNFFLYFLLSFQEQSMSNSSLTSWMSFMGLARGKLSRKKFYSEGKALRTF
jgi:hypothetical protein